MDDTRRLEVEVLFRNQPLGRHGSVKNSKVADPKHGVWHGISAHLGK